MKEGEEKGMGPSPRETKKIDVRFEVFTLVTMKNVVF
jgi:hypothetical protein